MEPSGRYAVTPEAVRVRLDVAEAGSRMIALLIDHAIQGAVVLAVMLTLGSTLGGVSDLDEIGTVLLFLTFFLVVWGYFPFFELVWHGQTPGKRALRLRVIAADGAPARPAAILTRNLMRIVDFLPASYALGVISMLVTKRAQRLGDLAASTVVVREARPPAARSAPLPPPVGDHLGVDTGGLTPREDALVHSFLARRDSLDAQARAALAASIAGALRARTNTLRRPGEGDEAFIEAVARALRAP